jgi:hypothetical protein
MENSLAPSYCCRTHRQKLAGSFVTMITDDGGRQRSGYFFGTAGDFFAALLAYTAVAQPRQPAAVPPASEHSQTRGGLTLTRVRLYVYILATYRCP